jgi:endonuclease/exonuclease/phosphatase family metal-dependent hydrolase
MQISLWLAVRSASQNVITRATRRVAVGAKQYKNMIQRLLRRNGRHSPAGYSNGYDGRLHEDTQSVTYESRPEIQKVRLMTYNIHHGRGVDGKYDLDRIADVIRSQRPDIVGIQETEQYRRRTRHDDQPAILAGKLGMTHAFAKVIEHGDDGHPQNAAYGNAILTRFPIAAQEHFNISYSGAMEPRGCLHTTLDVNGTPLHVFCVHLGLRYRERHFQIERLVSDEVVNNNKFGDGPKLMLGDFNNWWPVKTAKLVDLHFKNACLITGKKRLQTFGRFLCLDYIYVSHELNIVSCEVVKNPLAKVASDHSPLVCTVQMSGARTPAREVHQAYAAVNSPLT